MSGFEDMFNEVESLKLEAALMAAYDFRMAKRQLLRRLADPVRLNPDNYHWLLGSWTSYYSARHFAAIGVQPDGKPKVPWGWRIQECYARDLYRMMPLWLWLVVTAWERRYAVYHPFIRLGFLTGPEGGYYAEFKWNWRFWRSQRVAFGPAGWWQRLAKWCRVKEWEYLRDVPRPFAQPWFTTITISGFSNVRMGDIIRWGNQYDPNGFGTVMEVDPTTITIRSS